MTDLFQDHIRKPFVVGAVQITPMNMAEVAAACGGEVRHDGKKEGHFSRDYIKVKVKVAITERQTEGYVGDWIVRQGRTFKVYPDKQFRSTFDLHNGGPVEKKQQSRPKSQGQKRKPQPKRGPSPSQMPKKRTERTPDQQITEHLVEVSDDVDLDLKTGFIERREGGHLHVKRVSDEDNGEQILRAHFGETEEMAARRRVEEAQSKQEFTGVPPGTPKLIDVLREESTPAESAQQEIVKEEAETKPITLDELNSMAGDTRSAEDIYREAREAGGGKAYPEQTPGEQFRGEA